jgi:hypothetical protein
MAGILGLHHLSGRIGSMPEHGPYGVQAGTGPQHSCRRRVPEQVGAREGGSVIPARFSASRNRIECCAKDL